MLYIRHTVENTITWPQLKAAVEAGNAPALINPFNEIDILLEDGEPVTLVAGAHLPPTEDKPAGLRFMFKDCLAEPYRMNDDWTNRGGYQASEGRRHVLEDIYPSLPADLRAVIRPRKIVEIIGGKSVEYEDSLWLPSETDMFGRGPESWQNGAADGPEDFRLPIFTTERDRVKQRQGYGTTPYWCRSPSSSNSSHFCLVGTDGSANGSGACLSWAVAPGFDL